MREWGSEESESAGERKVTIIIFPYLFFSFLLFLFRSHGHEAVRPARITGKRKG